MKLDLNKLEAMQNAMAKIITVCKSGTPSPEAVSALSDDLNAVYVDIGGLLDGNTKVDKVGLSTRLGDITALAESLSSSTHDLNVQDQLDSLLDKVKEAYSQVEAMPADLQIAPVPTDTAVKWTEGDKATWKDGAWVRVEATASPTLAPAPAPAPAPAATELIVAPSVAPVATQDATPDVTPIVTAADAVAVPTITDSTDAEVATEVVTKADLADFGKSIVEGFKGAMGELTTTLKSAPAPRVAGTVLPPAGQAIDDAGTTAQNADDMDDGKHWGNHFDLNAEN